MVNTFHLQKSPAHDQSLLTWLALSTNQVENPQAECPLVTWFKKGQLRQGGRPCLVAT